MKRLRIGFCLAFCVFAGAVSAQSKAEIIAYMRDNHATFGQASSGLGLSPEDAARIAGYDASFSGFVSALYDMKLALVECIGLAVQRLGSAANIGLTEDRLEEFLRLRIANDLGFLPQCSSENVDANIVLLFEVWTVGEDYPVAYHIDLTSRYNDYINWELSGPFHYHNAVLGYANARDTRASIEDFLSRSVREFGYLYLRVLAP